MTPIFWTNYSPEIIKGKLNSAKFSAEKTNKKITYINAVISFDIETSSFYCDGEKRALMYCWQSIINGVFIMGRTYDDLIEYLKFLSDFFETDDKKHIIVWVHNLSYEFQFIRKHIEWSKVFAVDKRTPVYAVTTSGIEFRCSYILSGYSLANLAKKVGLEKKVGDLDYSKIRTPETPLTKKEIGYCYYDCLIVCKFIESEIKNNRGLSRIPLTKTGYVRRYCKNACYYDKSHGGKKYRKYRAFMETMTISGADEYALLKRAFQGGFTHANCFSVGKVFENVSSYDLTSSYPAVMLSEKYPMRSGTRVFPKSKKDFTDYCKNYCCVFDIAFCELKPKIWYEHALSQSRCRNARNVVVDNGRVVTADYLETTLTNIDLDIISEFYTYSSFKIGKMYIYEKEYLPRDFLKSILKLYGDKTTLKGVEGKEVDYSKSKEMINSAYGMTVTDIVREVIEYSGDEWACSPCSNIDAVIEKYNKSRNRFLFYPWGVFVTAYARRNLFAAIKSVGADYLYSDTDSVKILNGEKHARFFELYNKNITKKVEKCLQANHINPDLAAPKTIDGIKKPLGVWDFEGVYTRFKTLGAKRYMVEQNGDFKITVAGVSKKAVDYIVKFNPENPFACFDFGLHIPADETGKNTHTYIDEETEGAVKDYTGRIYHFKELSCIHLEGSTYDMSISDDFSNFLQNRESYRY